MLYSRKNKGVFSLVEPKNIPYLFPRAMSQYTFFTGGDLLDAPKWDARRKEGQTKGTQHDAGHFDIALELARYVAE